MAGRDDWNPDTAGRSLAEILREAGIERADRAGRRRSWDDPDETAIRQRRADAAADRSNRAGYGRRKGDLADRMDAAAAADRAAARPVERAPDPRGVRRVVPEPSTAAIPGLRPDRRPGVPHPSAPLPSGPIPPLRERAAPDRAAPDRAAPERAGRERPARGKAAPDRSAQERVPAARERSGARSAVRARDHDPHPSTGPIPVVRPEDLETDADAGPRESALAWLRFGGELVIAVAAGVGVYFAATLLWEQLPHLAVFLAPLAVAGLVAGVSMWRQRQGGEPIGPRLLAVLVFAGTLLTIAPAAGLLAAAT
jgi:hypothetical protein